MAAVTINVPIKAQVYKTNKIWTLYNKKYNISGYGRTKKEAKEMFLFCVKNALVFKPIK